MVYRRPKLLGCLRWRVPLILGYFLELLRGAQPQYTCKLLLAYGLRVVLRSRCFALPLPARTLPTFAQPTFALPLSITPTLPTFALPTFALPSFVYLRCVNL